MCQNFTLFFFVLFYVFLIEKKGFFFVLLISHERATPPCRGGKKCPPPGDFLFSRGAGFPPPEGLDFDKMGSFFLSKLRSNFAKN